MANIRCANCGSMSTTTGFDRIFCLDCGRETDLRGNLLPDVTRFDSPDGFRGGSQQGVRKVDGNQPPDDGEPGVQLPPQGYVPPEPVVVPGDGAHGGSQQGVRKAE